MKKVTSFSGYSSRIRKCSDLFNKNSMNRARHGTGAFSILSKKYSNPRGSNTRASTAFNPRRPGLSYAEAAAGVSLYTRTVSSLTVCRAASRKRCHTLENRAVAVSCAMTLRNRSLFRRLSMLLQYSVVKVLVNSPPPLKIASSDFTVWSITQKIGRVYPVNGVF